MREILFRGKRADNGEWVYGYYLKNDVTKQHYILKTGTGIPTMVQFKVIFESVSQSTNLLDKNGKKIFEGDIVEFKDKNYSKSLNYRRIVTFGNGCFLLKNIKTGVYTNFNMYQCEYCVIGNIHDNSELLEVD